MSFDVNIVLIVLDILLVIWLSVLTYLYFSAVRHYRFLKLEAGDTLESVVGKIYNTLGILSHKHESVLGTLGNIHRDALKHVQKVVLKRFNPFGDTGGDQSFSMALLDKRGDGIVLSSLHGRSGTRLYAKPIEKGKAIAYELSTEEAEVIKLAMQNDEE